MPFTHWPSIRVLSLPNHGLLCLDWIIDDQSLRADNSSEHW